MSYSRRELNHISFETKPSKETRDFLKSWGFWWDRRLYRWVALRSVESATIVDCLATDTPLEQIAERVAERRMEADAGII